MLIDVVEKNTNPSMLAFIEEANQEQAPTWGIARIKRAQIRPINNDELVLMLKPALQDAVKAKIFFLDSSMIYVAWTGMLGHVYKKLGAIAGRALVKPGSGLTPEQIVTYFDPRVDGNELKILIKGETKNPESSPTQPPAPATPPSTLEATSAQTARYKILADKRRERSKLNILMVEDQPFLRKLLQEILQETYEVEARNTAEDGWACFLETAPDIAFVDIGLPAIDGHTLAQKIKQIDPACYVVMLTASHDIADVERARSNQVDGFVTKPFSRRKIGERIDHFLSSRKKGSV